MVVSQGSEAASAGSGEVQESERDASLETPAKSETDGPEEGGLLQSDFSCVVLVSWCEYEDFDTREREPTDRRPAVRAKCQLTSKRNLLHQIYVTWVPQGNGMF